MLMDLINLLGENEIYSNTIIAGKPQKIKYMHNIRREICLKYLSMKNS